MPSKDDDSLELAVESALADYFVQCDRGEMPDRESFLAQNAEMRERLAELLSAADWIEQMAGPTASSLSNADAVPLRNDAPSLKAMASFPSANPFGITSPEQADTLPLYPKQQLVSEGTDRTGNDRMESSATDVNAPTLARTGESIVPAFSLGSLTPTQELLKPVLPCKFGEYVLERVLGRGGMGVVYAGRQLHLDRPVAVKMIRSGALASNEEVQRFYGEARSAAKLDHPNIVTVYQCGEHEGHHYFSMDLVGGTDLAKMIQHGPMEPRRAARYVRDVARAIQYAHDAGILHRDLKPANVLVDDSDQVHVTDFGLAKSIGHETGLTATGAAMGTPSYMSPEQAAGRTNDHDFRTDVYSLGAVLFALVTGKPPFQGSTIVQTIMQVMHRPAPLARQVRATVPLDLETIIAKCLHKSNERRYESAMELADDLERFLNDEPIRARPLSAFRKTVYWSMGIPIVGALIGRRVLEPSSSHTWAQRGLLIGLVILLSSFVTWWPIERWQSQQLPGTIHFAAGQAGGSYDFVGRVICKQLGKLINRPALSEVTEGSIDNRQRLIERKVDLALLQASTLKSNQIAVIAPLYYEAVHVLVRVSSGIESVDSFRGRDIIVGSERSGSRQVAERILQKHGMELADVNPVNDLWFTLGESTSNGPVVDAAIVVVQLGNTHMSQLLGSGQFKLLPLSDAIKFSLDVPSFHMLPITNEHYPNAQLPPDGLTTVATTAYLTTRTDCSNALVRKALETIYTDEVSNPCKLLSPKTVATWDVFWHPEADRFFEAYRNPVR